LIKIKTNHLNLDQIADSGQVFRWEKKAPGVYAVSAFDNVTEISASPEGIFVDSPEKDRKRWENYFDLDTDYSLILFEGRRMSDPFLSAAMEYGNGIRILRQDLWEVIISFLVSQNNNIPRIRKILAGLEEPGGRFPTAAELLSKNLGSLGLGYRDRYLESAAKWWLSRTVTEAAEASGFQDILGVGAKVEQCIRLYGQHKLDSVPVDTWIRKIREEDYNGKIPEWAGSRFAGAYQQYVFYYKRALKGELKKN